MAKNPNDLSGGDLLGLSGKMLPDSTSSSRDSIFVKRDSTGLGGGGGGKRPKPAEDSASSDLEAMDIPLNEEPVEEKPKEPEAVLSEAAWVKPDTLFQQEADVTVKLTLPPGQGHITRVEGHVFAKLPSGLEPISKGEGHADKDGKATFRVPIYPPKNHQGEAVEYILKFTHKLAKALEPEALLRKIQEYALKSADHTLVPGIMFDQNTSFIKPEVAGGLKSLESKMKEWEKKFPKGKIVIFGHANPDEEYGKLLSERRAESAYAFITNDADTWERLYNKEKWGVSALQRILKDLKHFDGTPIDKHGPQTTNAIRAFQHAAGIKEDGENTPATRKALFAAYMKGKHDIKIDAGRFRKVGANPWMGCSANNRTKNGDSPIPANRRVAFLLIDESKLFPVNFPCQDGAEAGCAGQCKRPGKRSMAGVKCAFYDELVREVHQTPANTESKTGEVDIPPWVAIARAELESKVVEIPGSKHNPRILEYHKTTTQAPNNDDSTGAWCASFVNWCLHQSGNNALNSARAVDWKHFGRKVEAAIVGSVGVVHFEEGGHHVGFVVGKKGNRILLLGGNQDKGTRVSVSAFPKSQIVEFRMPSDYAGPDIVADEKDGVYGEDNFAGTR